MAAGKSILKLVVDDKEYGSKLKNAQNALNALEAVLQGTGKSFAQVDKAVVDYAKSIGQMSAQATSARGKIGEMTSTFTELSLKYRQLTEDEKKSPFGQALSASLDQLRTRTINAKRELEELNNELSTTQKGGGGGGLFSGGKLSGMLQVAGGNLMAKGAMLAAGALSNLTSEITQCVSQGIELAKQGEGIRNAFERLGRGDLLAGLREATHGTVTDLELMKAAVKFDDFKLNLDELGTMLAFAQQKAKDTGQSVDYMVDSIVTGLGRKSLMILDNLGLSATEIRERMKETGDMTKAVGEIIREQMAKAGEYVETAADRAAQANVSLQNKMEELGRKFAPVEEASTQLWTSMKIKILDVVSGPLARMLNVLTEAGRAMNAFQNMGGNDEVNRRLSGLRGSNHKNVRYNAALRGYDREITRLQTMIDNGGKMPGARSGEGRDIRSLTAELNAVKKMRAEYVAGARSILNPTSATPLPTGGAGGAGGTGSSGKGGITTKQEIEAVAGSIDYQAKKVQELQKAWRAAADDDSRQKIKKEIEEAQFVLDILTGKTSGIPKMNYGVGQLAGKKGSGVYQGGFELAKNDSKSPWQLNEKAMKALGNEIARINGKREGSLTKELGNISSGISGIMGGMESLGIELPQGMKDVVNGIQAVVSILTGIASIITAIQTISTANLFKVFAGGGVVRAADGFTVPGNNFSGDMVPALLNSGEVVLNRAQQGNLVSQLHKSDNGMSIVGKLSGEDIVLVINRFFRRTGQGEILTWRG